MTRIHHLKMKVVTYRNVVHIKHTSDNGQCPTRCAGMLDNFGLFHDNASNCILIVCESGRTGKEAYLKTYCHHLPGGTDENHKKHVKIARTRAECETARCSTL
jgi:hypothetical protein